MARVVQRLAVLLSAGVAPASAWQYVDSGEEPFVSGVATSVGGGTSVGQAIVGELGSLPADGRQPWRALAAAWIVATDAGAPLAASLRSFAESLRALADAQREIGVALAAPAATARLVMALPLIAVLFGSVLGFDTLGTLFTTVPGAVCLALGVTLTLAARAWNRRLVAAAQPKDAAPGLRFELMAIAVSGGGSLDRATASVAGALEAAGLTADDSGAGVQPVLELSRRAGVPAGELLRSEAEEVRRNARAEAAQAASVLAVWLMLPLGLCVLPAFMVLGVAPLMIAVVTTTVTGF